MSTKPKINWVEDEVCNCVTAVGQGTESPINSKTRFARIEKCDSSNGVKRHWPRYRISRPNLVV